jgi:putative addiction module component (TIGR02574 family)
MQYTTYMTEDVKKVLNQALALTEVERAGLAASLIASLEEEETGDVEAAWEVELKARIEDLDSGNTVGITWSSLFCNISNKNRYN